jgi:hypothetical protein
MTWREYADWIRRSGEYGAEPAARAIEDEPGLVGDFALRVDPIPRRYLAEKLARSLRASRSTLNPRAAADHQTRRSANRDIDAKNLVWHRTKRHEGPLAKGDYVSNELAPGIRYELRRREGWDVYLRHRDEALRVDFATGLKSAKHAAAMDAKDLVELAREIVGVKTANPADRWDMQTVIVDKSVAPTRKDATEVARDFAKRIYTSRETKTSWRFRQRPPGDFVKGTFRTRPIRARGVSLIYGRLKRGAKPATKRR